MDKGKLIINCKYVYILLIIHAFCINSQAQNFYKKMPHFENKSQLLEWGSKEIGYCGDTASFNVDGKNLFVLYGDYLSGAIKKNIFVFLSYDGIEWELLCYRDTNTSKVNIELNKEKEEVIFKAENNKVLMILPFNSLNTRFNK